ncbi:MAG: FAD-dependent oxidoreductase [Opitutales bacterium]|nr:FAD-dependent oxidoreductase [Opitutales bacterium]NRA26146.1 FAD-dependent oxidoreductase [Opitutales bacterium]
MPVPASDDADILIVGAGVSGLVCALRAQELGLKALILEKDTVPGGRVGTSQHGDCRTDHGFQILLTAYPEVQRFLNLDALDLGFFSRGAHIWEGKNWRSLVAPVDEPAALKASLFNAPLQFGDYLRLAKTIWSGQKADWTTTFTQEACSTLRFLEADGFSNTAIELFFKPFLGGVFLDDKLETSAAMFRFVMDMFARGRAALPAGGMEAIPEQLVTRLDGGTLRTDCPVASINVSNRTVHLEDGTSLQSRAIVVATDAHVASQFFPDALPKIPFNASRAWCFRMERDNRPKEINKTLRLISDPQNPLRLIACPSAVASGYAPSGVDTVTITPKVGAEDLEESAVRKSLKTVLGSCVETWDLIAKYHIPRSLPRQQAPDFKSMPGTMKLYDHVYLSGDAYHTRSLNGAMLSGRLAAEAIAQNPTTS